MKIYLLLGQTEKNGPFDTIICGADVPRAEQTAKFKSLIEKDGGKFTAIAQVNSASRIQRFGGQGMSIDKPKDQKGKKLLKLREQAAEVVTRIDELGKNPEKKLPEEVAMAVSEAETELAKITEEIAGLETEIDKAGQEKAVKAEAARKKKAGDVLVDRGKAHAAEVAKRKAAAEEDGDSRSDFEVKITSAEDRIDELTAKAEEAQRALDEAEEKDKAGLLEGVEKLNEELKKEIQGFEEIKAEIAAEEESEGDDILVKRGKEHAEKLEASGN